MSVTDRKLPLGGWRQECVDSRTAAFGSEIEKPDAKSSIKRGGFTSVKFTPMMQWRGVKCDRRRP